METDKRALPGTGPTVLASDLDGTFIPLDDHPENQNDLSILVDQLQRLERTLLYVTGRHFELTQQAIKEKGLPTPDWLICDVGTSIYHRDPRDADKFNLIPDYQEHQARIVSELPVAELRQVISERISGLRLQEPEKQGRFKLSYYTAADQLPDQVAAIEALLKELDAPYSLIDSVDPFTGDGLIDFLPQRISKAAALAWWVEFEELQPESVVFAGDSGNDLAALTAGYEAILVGNADRAIARQAYDFHRRSGWRNRLYLARHAATSGVLEGCRWYGLVEPEEASLEKTGAYPLTTSRTQFRVWASRRESVEVEANNGSRTVRTPLQPLGGGYFGGVVDGIGPHATYRYLLDGEVSRPDPQSRYQPAGVHGPSEVVDPAAFPWTDQDWQGCDLRELIIYELHIGTFTPAGTFRAAIEQLSRIVELGATAIEIMPVAQTPGKWNWGYDGVDLFAPRNSYGQPDDFKALVDACHAAGLSVLLDVVYNHVGPEGNYLADFAPYRSEKFHTPWGDALNLDEADSGPVRQFVLDNVLYWLDEFHLDGLRLDAVHFIQDDHQPHILEEIRSAVSRFEESARRQIHLIAESNVYDRKLLRGKGQGDGVDAIWCDCLMHSIYSNALPDLHLTHRRYRGASDLAEALKYGYLYEGPRQQRVTGRSEAGSQDDAIQVPDQEIESFVIALQNHDLVGNHPAGKRMHQLISVDYQKSAAALILLHPGVPLLFMGEAFACERPFPFFVDFEDTRLQAAIDEGRAREYPHHVWEASLTPSDPATFEQARWNPATDVFNESVWQWYQALIRLRKQGLSAGWLNARAMSIEHDPQRDLFVMRYQIPGSPTISVAVRLAGDTAEESVSWESHGRLLLSSRGEPRSLTDGRVPLGRREAIVAEEPTR